MRDSMGLQIKQIKRLNFDMVQKMALTINKSLKIAGVVGFPRSNFLKGSSAYDMHMTVSAYAYDCCSVSRSNVSC